MNLEELKATLKEVNEIKSLFGESAEEKEVKSTKEVKEK